MEKYIRGERLRHWTGFNNKARNFSLHMRREQQMPLNDYRFGRALQLVQHTAPFDTVCKD